MDTSNERFSGFSDIVTSFDDIRNTIGEPFAPVVAKVLDHLDDVCRDFIARSPFVVIASSGASGQVDLSPKGDPAGFVQVLDDKHLAIPDRPGNRRIDTFHNLFENPHVGLLFIIPGKNETLRISGEARIVRDHPLRASMAVQGRIPDFALVIYVERAYMHCAKCMIRSKLWQPDAWPDQEGLTDFIDVMIMHAKLDQTPEEHSLEAEKAGMSILY